ncbi:hypothetical protein [Tuberibacillus calidus]|uniref:hypothetical protein n=1 Tax=Tuberibacillus calidus TaxID=340097 RepID=UPI0004175FD7|nr:hypothetical protein [Tuberibacillus calidus]
MNGNVILPDERLIVLLNEWYEQSWKNKRKEEIDRLLSSTENELLLKYHALLSERQKVGRQNLDDSFERELAFYYHLYKGNMYFYQRHNREAEKHFQQAANHLSIVENEFARAEFYYKYASLYYFTYRIEQSLDMAKKALMIFEKDPRYVKRAAHCYIAIGLNFISLKKFTSAEDCLALAWATAVYEGDIGLQGLICHDLGLLYKDKGDLATSIKWLLESMKYIEPDDQTYYLLAEAAYLLGQKGNAKNWTENGIKVSQSLGHLDYWHRFQILQARFGNAPSEEFAAVLEDAITFFVEEGLWHYVAENGPILIDFYLKSQRNDEAAFYQKLVSKARQKIKAEKHFEDSYSS